MSKSNNPDAGKRVQKAVKSAVWSVRAEGLKPTKSATRNLRDYATGRITVSEMRQKSLANARELVKAKPSR